MNDRYIYGEERFKRLDFYNDLYFNLNTGNEDMSQKEIDLIQQVEEAKLTPDKHIEINETYIITKIADITNLQGL